MPVTAEGKLRDSYRLCREITRNRARNFHYGIQLLPGDRRDALSAVYAFFRACDDVADREEATGDRRRELERWRDLLDPEADPEQHPILPAFHHAVRRYGIPRRYFSELIDGVLMDLEGARYPTFRDLYTYCYRVASTVGLVCLHIFGFDGSRKASELAEKRGIAFQLTNILRDLSEDVERGRIYLPLEDLERFEVTPAALLAGNPEPGFGDLVRFECRRAGEYYRRSEALLTRIDPDSRPALAAMTGIYRRLLEKIERAGRGVLERRMRLSAVEKLRVAARCWLQLRRLGGRA